MGRRRRRTAAIADRPNSTSTSPTSQPLSKPTSPRSGAGSISLGQDILQTFWRLHQLARRQPSAAATVLDGLKKSLSHAEAHGQAFRLAMARAKLK